MTDYPLLRASLAPQYAQLPPDRLNDLVRSIYGPNATAEDVEGLFDDIGGGLRRAAGAVGNFAQKAAPMVARALPNVASGAAGGAAFGPWGALVGAGAGLASGLLSQSGNRTARGIGGAIHNVGGLVSTVRGGGANGALGSLTSVASGALGKTRAGRAALSGIQTARGGASSGGAANMLAGLLARPELTQSLLSSLMGGAGRQNLSVGGQQVPVSQMLSALSNIAGRAAHEAAEAEGSAEATPEYASLAAEAFGIDPEDAEGRTDALLTLLALTPSIWMSRQAPPVNVQVNPADPYFPAGESGWSEWDAEASFDEDWSQEDWDSEDWDSEDYAESDEAVEHAGV
ncbi:hypothetical protein [Sphingomonas psychrotolerans]|uniref:Uncharacterized protein n=1 Tax=Sphingomonas psychrotolerans TaxID=1327635 RepID=A0A2K8MAK0_9SPHN|nr:hypothetical protein [Sphingomonas psychrotolerans]ATY30893.1 hypothetical protein CVN68_01920 [Sphingomonas psychrotolerans]